jgi:WD40 repeat protein
MKMTPDDRYIIISTYTYELAVIELKKTKKFNNQILQDEEFLKIQRNKSVGGAKKHILDYDFSNDNRFFIISGENRVIKIYQNYGNVEDSKIINEVEIREKGFDSGEKVALYVTNFYGGKISGLVAVSCDGDILLTDIEGKTIRIFKNAHESKIVMLKIVNDFEDKEKKLLISAAMDGKVIIYNLN